MNCPNCGESIEAITDHWSDTLGCWSCKPNLATLERLANLQAEVEAIKTPPITLRRWGWVYGFRLDENNQQQDRVDQMHLFPVDYIPTDMRGRPQVPLLPSMKPACGYVFDQTLTWGVFNTGGGDARALAKYAGNRVDQCENCKTIDKESV